MNQKGVAAPLIHENDKLYIKQKSIKKGKQ
jgi:hypothetical protein